ncbi:endonuclease domain-containing protein [Azospirillum sp.]|uniref:endonuclease domain-containing protein n=1 Tax=Azospirillum sp. TaxID=34012 RepID=UPI003D729C9C
MPRIPDDTKDKVREMRRVPTDAERRLWSILRRRQLGGWYFRRQHPIPPYIADFACVEAMVVVEADGGQHADSERDLRRDRYMERHGWTVLRFWNPEILVNPQGVAETILLVLGERSGKP